MFLDTWCGEYRRGLVNASRGFFYLKGKRNTAAFLPQRHPPPGGRLNQARLWVSELRKRQRAFSTLPWPTTTLRARSAFTNRRLGGKRTTRGRERNRTLSEKRDERLAQRQGFSAKRELLGGEKSRAIDPRSAGSTTRGTQPSSYSHHRRQEKPNRRRPPMGFMGGWAAMARAIMCRLGNGVSSHRNSPEGGKSEPEGNDLAFLRHVKSDQTTLWQLMF